MIKPYYEHAGITIYHDDCFEIMPELPQVDLVLTDPPYGINLQTDFYKRKMDKLAKNRDYAQVQGDDKPFDPKPILSLQVPTLLFGANYFADKLPPSSGWIVWDKKRPPQLDQSTCELAWTNFIKGVRIFRFMWHGMIREGRKEKRTHPTQKPVELFKWILMHRWTPSGTVLDPFMGSGTTLVAAKELGRKAIGIEIEEKYVKIAIKRLEQEVLPFS
jgi:DNA modification methylase